MLGKNRPAGFYWVVQKVTLQTWRSQKCHSHVVYSTNLSGQYSPAESTIQCQRLTSAEIAFWKNDWGLEAKKVKMADFTSSSFSNSFPSKTFCIDLNRWKSVGAMSGACGVMFQPNASSSSLTSFAMCGLALSCNKCTSVFVGRRVWIVCRSLSNW